jgi:hypothetical protein
LINGGFGPHHPEQEKSMTNAECKPQIVWLEKGKITCPDVAAMWGANVGEDEFSLLDHPTRPGSSSDHPTKEDAMQYAKENGLAVVDMT